MSAPLIHDLPGGQHLTVDHPVGAPRHPLPTDQPGPDTRTTSVGGHPLDRGQDPFGPHAGNAAVDPSSLSGQPGTCTHTATAGEGTHADRPIHPPVPMVTPAGQRPSSAPSTSASSFATPRVGPRWSTEADALLALLADVLLDMERTRIANENRLRSLRTVKQAGGLPGESALVELIDGLLALEHRAELELKRAVRKHPLGPWVKRTVGVGEKQAGRLLGMLGDPYWHPVHDRPRLVSELWSYAGYGVVKFSPGGHLLVEPHSGPATGGSISGGGDAGQLMAEALTRVAGVAPSRARGQKAAWNAELRMRTYLIAESCMKQRTSPYRVVYDQGRERYREALHAAPCKRCGPAGKPAPEGSPLSDGHQHARALRLVSKALLRDLWAEAKAIHEGGDAGHGTPDAQGSVAGVAPREEQGR